MKEIAHRPDWGLLEAGNDPNLGPQLERLLTEGKGEFLLPPRIQKYLAFRRTHAERLGPKGDSTKGEIEILDNPLEILTAEKTAAQRLINRGLTEEEAIKRVQVGVRAEDQWGAKICDAVKFPGGAFGTYVRDVSWGKLETGTVGVAILPQLEDGRFVLTRAFRHATRDWVLEIPRGGMDVGASIVNTIKGELKKEGGVELAVDPVDLGQYAPDSGILESRVPLYHAKVKITGKEIPEETEAISGLVLLTKEQLSDVLREGKYTDSQGKTYDCTDGFTQAAFNKAHNLGLI